jgi:hypothetical protein
MAGNNNKLLIQTDNGEIFRVENRDDDLGQDESGKLNLKDIIVIDEEGNVETGML